MTATPAADTPFWAEPIEALYARLGSRAEGLTAAEAAQALVQSGPNLDAPPARFGQLKAIRRRLLEPLALILVCAAIVSAATGDVAGASIILTIVLISVGLDTVQEGRALKAAESLRQAVALTAEVLRDGVFLALDVAEVVPGDIVRVRTGDIVPADIRLIASFALSTSEAALTGEPYPVLKAPGDSVARSPAEAANALFRGSVVQAGEGTGLVAGTGRATVFGEAAAILTEAEGPSAFERDLHGLGLLIARLTLALALVILTAHVVAGRPVLQSLMFAVALAVGLTPELLPMITTVTLSRGAMRLAARKVIVKRLAAIHDLGAMTVLCTDKTGTLTEARIQLDRSVDPDGGEDRGPARLAAIAATLGGDRGGLDAALAQGEPKAAEGWSLISQRPFDYQARVGAVRVKGPDGELTLVKGAPEAVMARCATVRTASGLRPMDDALRASVVGRVKARAEEGFRAVAIASGADWGGPTGDEKALTLEGFCLVSDPIKPTAKAAVARLAEAGVKLKILSGDDPIVVRRLAGLVGLRAERVLSGPDIADMPNAALAVQLDQVDAFARLSPDQKARIVRLFRERGEVVGYLGDGVNDAPGLKTADVGLSVEGATGVARAAADMILLDSDLAVVADGVEEGRRTFINIMKYVRMGASSNIGNMLSMGVASLFLPFLPMLPTQILLNNLLYDISEIGIPLDHVSPAALRHPQVWSLKAIARFSAVMGPLSSVFDLLTFAALLLVFHAAPAEFRTGWFLESMATQILVIFVIRTRGLPWKALPHPWLTATSLGALAVAVILPFTPLGAPLGFVVPRPAVLATIGLFVVIYLLAAQGLKRFAFPQPAKA
ncbi:magnesium-translocating P-type ATPase [Phenylobacterium aquaticum]|uniref:magnesium-translocating P-type ATPase n=1 Tax=Phenylobacterium aquaticum TaxID=1763816 RepID=UPI0026EB278B|nr:magnesium-translocating P-type ATPase [Phenylobacterium aquaticum]